MNVKHHLPTVGVTVSHHAVSALGYAQPAGDLLGCQKDVTDDGFVLRGEIVERGDVLLGDNQDVRRGVGVDVPESQADVVLKDDLGRDLSGNNLAEDAVAHLSNLPARCVPWRAVRGQFTRGLWIAVLAMLLFSCASVPGPDGKDLKSVVERFHHDLRWKYYDAAAERVNPEHAQAFLDDVEDEKNALNISAWEIRKVELLKQGAEAKIRVGFKYYRMPSTVLQSENCEQIWRKTGTVWLLFEQVKGPFVLPPPGAVKKDPGGAEDAPTP
jgi:hypothetical protein